MKGLFYFDTDFNLSISVQSEGKKKFAPIQGKDNEPESRKDFKKL